jgi:hypothetical protein
LERRGKKMAKKAQTVDVKTSGITMRDGHFLFPTAKDQQTYLKGLDPFKCAPRQGGRVLAKSPTASLPMVEEARYSKSHSKIA